MNFEQKPSMLFADLDVPEVFISEYLGQANGDYVKIYLYCLLLCKHGREISVLDLSKKLSLPLPTIEEGLKYWEANNVILKKQKTYILSDLKQIEVDKMYKLKVTTSVEDAVKSNTKNIIRIQTVNTINAMFFQGVMSPTWYTDIDMIFSKYGFDEDVVISLFQYCFDRQALHKNYLFAVADGWSKSNIKTMQDLDDYYASFEKLLNIKKTVSKKLGLSRKLSQYEEAYIDKWVTDFNYPLGIIEIALKKTTSKTNPSFDYLDKIITDWHERNLSTEADINTFLLEQKQKRKEFKVPASSVSAPAMKNFAADTTSQFNDLSKFYMN